MRPLDKLALRQGPRDVYLGLTGAVLGTIPTALLYFATYEYCKERLAARGRGQACPWPRRRHCAAAVSHCKRPTEHGWDGLLCWPALPVTSTCLRVPRRLGSSTPMIACVHFICGHLDGSGFPQRLCAW